MRISVSIFTPNAFSMRSAISPERSARPLGKLDSAGRDTRSGSGRHRQAGRLDDFGPTEISRLGRVLHTHRSAHIKQSAAPL